MAIYDRIPEEPSASLEQWHILKTVVEQGSYQAAADALLKSQSSVSYAIDGLQRSLGVKLFEKQGRKAVLTEVGRQILQRAEQLLNQARGLEQAAADFAAGWEAEISVVVEMIFPVDVVRQSLQQFAERCPKTRIEIYSESLSGVVDSLQGHQVDLALTAQVPTGFVGERLLQSEILRVAAPNHPVFASGVPVSEAELRQFRQVVVRDSGSRRRIDAGWLGADARWTVSSFHDSVPLIVAGLAIGSVPRSLVEPELESGRLRVVEQQGASDRPVYCHLVYPPDLLAGPATESFADCVRNASRAFEACRRNAYGKD